MARETFGEGLRRWRHTNNVTAKRLAQLAHFSPGYISLLEHGHREPNAALAKRFDDLLNANGDLIRLARQSEEESAVNRRTLLLRLGAVGLAGVPVLALDDLRHIAAALENSHRYLDTSVVNSLRTGLEATFADDGDRGPRHSLAPVLGLLAAVESNAGRVKQDVRKDLLSLGAQGAEFAGWLYHDIGIPESANYWLDRAMEWAQAAGDSAMQGYILLKKSQVSWGSRDAVRMLTLAQAVQTGPWSLPAKVRAEAAQQEARGHAMLGENDAMVEAKLDESHSTLAINDPASTDPFTRRLSAHYSPALLAIQTAICYCEAGKPEQAITTYEGELSLDTFPRRDYGYFLSLMAGTFIKADEPDEASRVGLEALEYATQTKSARTVKELVRVTKELAPWSERTSVSDFREAVRVTI